MVAANNVLQLSRREIIPIPSQTKGTTNPLVFRLPKVGILAGIIVSVKGSVAGTLSAPNAMGMASIVKLIECSVNGAIRIMSFSGPQYHYLMRDCLEDYVDVGSYSNARSAVTATTFNLPFWIPFAVNQRDPLGMFMLQNEQTELTLSVEFESDALVATGATVTATVAVSLVVFTTPPDHSDWPDFSIVHSIIAETRTISASGVFQYTPIRGQTYLQLMLGYGMAQSSPSDKWNSYTLRAMGAQILEKHTPEIADQEYTLNRGRTRLLGTFVFDWLGSSGLGSFGSARDAVLSQNITDLVVELDANAADTWHAVRRQFIQLN